VIIAPRLTGLVSRIGGGGLPPSAYVEVRHCRGDKVARGGVSPADSSGGTRVDRPRKSTAIGEIVSSDPDDTRRDHALQPNLESHAHGEDEELDEETAIGAVIGSEQHLMVCIVGWLASLRG
jgi:hypothetical protein